MGTLIYDSTVRADFEDRTLAHLQLAITSKLRRGESFTLTWKDDPSIGDGRTTVWINPAVSLIYKFHGSRQPQINPRWVELLVLDASTASGMRLVPEPTGAGSPGSA
jgi:hypothetical protein